jgi:hypothetical protein
VKEENNMKTNRNYIIGAFAAIAVVTFGYFSFSSGLSDGNVGASSVETLEVVVSNPTDIVAGENNDNHEVIHAVEKSTSNDSSTE